MTARLALIAALALGCASSKSGDSTGSGGSGTGGATGGSAGTGGTGGTGGATVDAGNRDGAGADLAVRRDGPLALDAGQPNGACAYLGSGDGPVIVVGPEEAAQLPQIVAGAATGSTVFLKEGTYPLGGASLRFRTPGVTLRGAGNPRLSIIDAEYKTAEAVVISASDVTIAELTITHAVDHPIHVYPEGSDVKNTRLYILRIFDSGEQFVKVNPDAGRTHFVDGGRLECSFLQLTDAGRPMVETLGGTSCYTGGIDVHAGRGWVVRQNRFQDIYCTTGKLAEHAVHFWTGSRDTVVENNVIVNCARGIGFGLVASGDGRAYPDDPYPGRGYIGHYDGLIRNNVIFAGIPEYDTGIELDQARGVRVYHNSILADGGATAAFSSIDARFPNTLADVRNNLVNRLTVRDGAASSASSNREMVPATYFVNPPFADFHLTAAAADAIDKGVTLPEAGLDLDGQPHSAGAAPDLGADER